MNIELLINNIKADLSQDIEISLDYQAIDTQKPTNEKNGYSKTIKLIGTPNNNAIFGNFFLLDNVVHSFNPRARIPYMLKNNGDLIEQGYLSLDKVTRDYQDNIEYSVTLYGGLGDFFYNLSYDSMGNEKRLSDLKFNFLDVQDEDRDTLMLWNKDTIVSGWSDVLSYSGMPCHPSDIIKGCPTYGGYNDDFDNEKVLIKLSGLPSSDQAMLTNGKSSSYDAKDGWVLAEASRELDSYEVKDLRSRYIHPSARLRAVLDAIGDPINNGGYTVRWDDEIMDATTPIGETFDKAFILMDEIDFDAENYDALNDAHIYDIDNCTSTFPDMYVSGWVYDNTEQEETYITSGMMSPTVELNLMEDIWLYVNGTKSNKLYTCLRFKSYYMESEKIKEYMNTVFGGWAIWLEAVSGDTVVASTPVHFMKSDNVEWGKDFPTINTVLASKIGCSEDELVFHNIDIVSTSDTYPTREHRWAEPIRIKMDLPQSDGIKIRLNKTYVSANILNDYLHKKETVMTLMSPQNGNQGDTYAWSGHTTLFNDDNENYANGVYDGTVNPVIQPMSVTKSMMFPMDVSPYDILIGITRAFDLRFLIDNDKKIIDILQRKHYYLEGINEIDGNISYNEGYEITPTLVESKWYKYGFGDADTYAQRLYAKKNKLGYGDLKVDTGYYFNKQTEDLFSDVVYQDVIPYKLNSIYFNPRNCKVLLSPTLDVTFWGTTTSTSGESETNTVYGDAHSHKLMKVFDKVHRLCCFGDDNKPTEIAPALVLYNGSTIGDSGFSVSDNIDIMLTLNNGACHLWTDNGMGIGEEGGSETRVAYLLSALPWFSKYITDGNGAYLHSIDFAKPTDTFIGDPQNYGDGITLYPRYWKKFIDNLYHNEARKVKVKMFINEPPKIAMRRVYKFEHSLWVISSISNYKIGGDDLSTVEFVKIREYADLF